MGIRCIVLKEATIIENATHEGVLLLKVCLMEKFGRLILLNSYEYLIVL